MSFSTAIFSLRLPRSLDEQIREAAEVRGQSLNAEIVARLSNSFGTDPRVGKAFDALEMPQAVRLRHASTAATVEHVLLMARLFEIDRLVFAARVDRLHEAVLMMVMQTAAHTIVLDKTTLNMSRLPRILEIAGLFRGLDELGLLAAADYCPHLFPEVDFPQHAHDAAALILSDTRRLERVEDFLQILASHEEFDLAAFGGAKPVKPVRRKRRAT
jgi:hypothetical protein